MRHKRGHALRLQIQARDAEWAAAAPAKGEVPDARQGAQGDCGVHSVNCLRNQRVGTAPNDHLEVCHLQALPGEKEGTVTYEEEIVEACRIARNEAAERERRRIRRALGPIRAGLLRDNHLIAVEAIDAATKAKGRVRR